MNERLCTQFLFLRSLKMFTEQISALQRFREISQKMASRRNPSAQLTQSVYHHHTGPVLKMDISFKFTEFYFIKENSFELQKLFLLPNCI